MIKWKVWRDFLSAMFSSPPQVFNSGPRNLPLGNPKGRQGHQECHRTKGAQLVFGAFIWDWIEWDQEGCRGRQNNICSVHAT